MLISSVWSDSSSGLSSGSFAFILAAIESSNVVDGDVSSVSVSSELSISSYAGYSVLLAISVLSLISPLNVPPFSTYNF